MNEYRVKGLSCPSCTMELERRIRKLSHGENAVLSYASGKLKLDPSVAMRDVERILREERAYIVYGSDQADGYGREQDPDHVHRHNPSHDHSHNYVLKHGQDLAHSYAHERGQDHNPDYFHEHGHDHNHDYAHDHGQDHDHYHGHIHGHDKGHDDHGHHHAHGGPHAMKWLLGAAAIYLVSLYSAGNWPDWITIALSVVTIAVSGYTTFVRGLRNLLRLRFNIDTLMTIALIGAVGIGDWKEGAFVALLFGLNEWLEGLGMEKARKSMESLLRLAPKQAVRLTEGREEIVPIAALAPGDLVLVKSGALIPSDGIVHGGQSSVNEAAITGESLPVEKTAGDEVFGGSLNNEGVLQVTITKAYKDSSLSKILHLVAEAQETKTPTELFINRFSRYYTPLIIAAAILVLLLPPLLLGGDWSKWLYQALAVLIVGCPCALILSSPIAILAGITRTARSGILVKGGVHLEQLGKIDLLAFDKTGTLTKGEPTVEETIRFDDRFYETAGALERTSSHPLALAVMREVEARGAACATAEQIETIPGQGVAGTIDGIRYRLGNESSLSHFTLNDEEAGEIQRLKALSLTLVIVSDDRRILGIFGIADIIRPETRRVIEELRRLGIRKTVMLTGDHSATARKIAEAAGISDFCANLLPEDKVNKIKQLSEHNTVAMVGDGINDAPALASASLGIAMGKGTDSAIETADVVLMQDHLGKLPEAVRIARRVNRTIRFNLTLALALKLAALLLTIPGWLTLWIAILSDMGATILVTLFSLTILIDPRTTAPPNIAQEDRTS